MKAIKKAEQQPATNKKKWRRREKMQQHISINLWVNRETFRFQMVMMMNGIKFN